MSTPDLTDSTKLNKFQKFFYEYGKYHRNPLNVIIHILCIPIITLTFFLMFDHISYNIFKLSFNVFFIIYAIWVPIYIYTDFITGAFTSALYPALYYLTRHHELSVFGLNTFQSVVLLHVAGWILQFIGHGVYEKRKPALMDNLLLMFNAPVFVTIELFYLMGYRKNEISETLKYIDANIAEYRKQKNL